MTRVRIWIPLLVIISSIWISRRPRVAGEEIRWVSGDINLVGTLVTPKGSGPFPLVVFIPGSGCVPRTHRILREHAQQLSSRGVAVFVYDKRGCGDSGGDWRAVGIAELADDVLAVLPTLIDHSSIDSDHIGLMGLSQGGWISVLAAEKTSDVSFLVWLSGTPLTPAEQGHAVIEMQLRSADWDEDVIARALELDREIVEVYRSDSGWNEVRARLEDVADEPWFEESGVGLLPRDHWQWRWLASFMDYDPVPALRELEVPLLAIFGERDHLVPPPSQSADPRWTGRFGPRCAGHPLDPRGRAPTSRRQRIRLARRVLADDRRLADRGWSPAVGLCRQQCRSASSGFT